MAGRKQDLADKLIRLSIFQGLNYLASRSKKIKFICTEHYTILVPDRPIATAAPPYWLFFWRAYMHPSKVMLLSFISQYTLSSNTNGATNKTFQLLAQTMDDKNQGEDLTSTLLGYIPHHTEDDYCRDVHHEGTNEYWYTIYRCSDCLRFHHPSKFEDQDVDDDMYNLSCAPCVLKKELKALKEWERDWHMTTSKEVETSSWTGNKYRKYKKDHSFECEKCWCMKKQVSYNYAEVEKAMEKREQPTCSQCLPDVPEQIYKLKAAEMKLYLEGWKCDMVEKGTSKKELQNIFQRACKKRLQKNFWKSQTKRDKGLKDPAKQRSLALSYVSTETTKKIFSQNKKRY